MDTITRVSLPQTITYLLLSIALVACSQKSPDPQQLPGSPPNFIVLIGDDMGVETLDCYQIGSNTAVTPNLNTLCDEGIRFDNFWAQAVCSPTRATGVT